MHSSTSATPVLLLAPAEAAIALSISQRTLFSLRAAGEIPSLKIGQLTRYAADDIAKWIGAQRNGGAE